MLLTVFRDLKPFILFFGTVIGFFSMVFAVLLKNDQSNYEGIGLFEYFMIAMR